MADSANVSVATPRPGGVGVLYRAPLGTAVPTDATTPLGPEFKDHGYVGESGIVNGAQRDVKKKKAFGGATVATLQTDYTETYKATLLEDSNAEVLKTTFGDGNVVTDVDGFPTKVKHNKSILPKSVYVVDTIDGEGRLKRDVIEIGQVTTVGDITKVHTDTVEYPLTIECFENIDGDNVVELREAPAASGTAAVPTLATFSPASVDAAGGDLVHVTGSGFTGTVNVKIAGVNASEFTVISDQHLVFVADAHTAGTVAIIVTNATGPSAAKNLTYA